MRQRPAMIVRLRRWLANGWGKNTRAPSVPRRRKLAVFIDCDGVSAKDASSVLEWLKPHGKLVELRAYGNFTGSAGVTWSRLVTVQSVTSRHMPKIVAGKNASDIALTIDAIETLLSTDIDTFVLIASDSDFAPLAQRIRAQGREVLGFGQQSAPKAFRDSCTTFKEFRYLNC